jgi:hypothetical protein
MWQLNDIIIIPDEWRSDKGFTWEPLTEGVFGYKSVSEFAWNQNVVLSETGFTILDTDDYEMDETLLRVYVPAGAVAAKCGKYLVLPQGANFIVTGPLDAEYLGSIQFNPYHGRAI